MTPDLETRYRQLKAKASRQRAHLKRLERHVRVLDRARREAVHRTNSWRQHARALEDRYKHTDYRSVCRCWTCRLRRWWRFIKGETHPGQPGWRLPWAKP